MSEKVEEIIKWLSGYTEVPVEFIRKDCQEDIENFFKNDDELTLEVYLDCVSIDLMMKYECGWWYKTHKDKK